MNNPEKALDKAVEKFNKLVDKKKTKYIFFMVENGAETDTSMRVGLTRTSDMAPEMQLEILQQAVKELELNVAERAEKHKAIKEIFDATDVEDFLNKLKGVMDKVKTASTEEPATTPTSQA